MNPRQFETVKSNVLLELYSKEFAHYESQIHSNLNVKELNNLKCSLEFVDYVLQNKVTQNTSQKLLIRDYDKLLVDINNKINLITI